jgi:hypothetical protein
MDANAGNTTFLAMLEYMRELHLKKSAGYAGGKEDTWSNFREAENWGRTTSEGVEMRLADKYIRYRNIVTDPNNEQLGESVFETGIDGAAYFLIDLCVKIEDGEIPMPEELAKFMPKKEPTQPMINFARTAPTIVPPQEAKPFA